jgi:hypothetical protein
VSLFLNICPDNCIHAGKVSLSIGLEPLHNFAVEAKIDGSFAPWHNDPGTHGVPARMQDSHVLPAASVYLQIAQ